MSGIKGILVEAIIILLDNLYQKSNIGTEIIIFNKVKDRARRGMIPFKNASK